MEKEINKRIGELIHHFQYSNSEFADEIDVQRSSISHIISGRNKPSLDFLIKVKEQFPDLSWDWLIKGKGSMMIPKEEPKEIVEEKSSLSLPDLFSVINDDNFGLSEKEKSPELPQNNTPSESFKDVQVSEKNEINDSQRLEIQEKIKIKEVSDNQENKIKRIVLFYENGKFESFEP